MKYNKLINKIKKSDYDVSICRCLLDGEKIIYQPIDGKENSLCIYAYNKEIIEKIKNIADNMKYKTIFSNPTSPIKCYEVFIY